MQKKNGIKQKTKQKKAAAKANTCATFVRLIWRVFVYIPYIEKRKTLNNLQITECKQIYQGADHDDKRHDDGQWQ